MRIRTLASVFSIAIVLPRITACSSQSQTPPMDAGEEEVDMRPPTPPEWDRPVTRPDDMQAATDRLACKYGPGLLPGETLGKSTPVDKEIPIETIIILIQENHSFDNYFSQLNVYGKRTDIEVAPANATNPDVIDAGPDGTAKQVPFAHAPHLCTQDVSHSWNGSHLQWNGGKNDGFVESNEEGPPNGGGERGMYYYDQRDLPFYYDLATTFAIADHWHCALLGPTWPNRMYSYAATSFGRTGNDFPDLSAYPFPAKDASVLDQLERRHVSWGVYGTSGALTIYGPAALTRWGRKVTKFQDDFFADAKAGTLPQVVYLDVNLIPDLPKNPSEHPPADIQVGQKFVSDVVHAMFASPQWSKSALFFTYDEHGGYYDHLPPPPACVPDAIKPINQPTGAFDREGFRVPFVMISPYAKKGFVSHKTYDHASIVRFIQAKHRMPALTNRDANADIPTEMFDFANPPSPRRPRSRSPRSIRRSSTTARRRSGSEVALARSVRPSLAASRVARAPRSRARGFAP